MKFTSISKVFVINLKKRFDRRFLISRQLDKLNIPFELVEGTLSPGNKALGKGELGCLLSHFFVLKYAQHLKLKNCLILEDDAKFSKKFIENFEALDIPQDWDMLYLGGNVLEKRELPKRVNDKLFRCKNVRSNHAILINSSAYDTLLSSLSCDLDIDLQFIKCQEILNCYLAHPPLATQRPGASDIGNTFLDFTKAQEKLDKL